MCEFPKKGERLFISGSIYEQARIEDGNMPLFYNTVEAQFDRYTYGYKEAADALIQRALELGDNYTLDTYIYPICFLYRHYIEIALKNIYLSYSNDTEEEKTKTIKNHNLKRIWAKAKPVIIDYYPYEDRAVLDYVEDYIKQFDEADDRSTTFRYPIDRELKPVHKAMSIDLRNLKERMDELDYFLSSAIQGMSAMRESGP